MKKRFGTLIGLIAVAMLWVVTGCSDKSTTGSTGTISDQVRALQLVMGDSTLQFLPGDSASTNVVAIARDASGLVLANQRVVITLQNPLLGLLEYVDPARKDTTNDQGQVLLVYRSYGQFGANVITAQAGGVIATLPFTVSEAEGIVENMWVTVTPNQLNVGEGAIDSAFVRVVITQAGGLAIPGVNLNLRVAGGGHLGPITATDASGVMATWYYPDNYYGLAFISASAGGVTGQDTCDIRYILNTGTLTLTSELRRIKADGVSFTPLAATLRDQFGTAVIGDTIRFGTPSNRGVTRAFKITDESGVALDTLWGGGIPNDPDPSDSSLVVARYARWGLYDTVMVRIDPAADVESVVLSAGGQDRIVAGADSIGLTVTCRYDDASLVSGLPAEFFADCGFFTFQTIVLQDGHLSVNQYWKDCNAISPANTRYQIYCVVQGIESNRIEMLVDPGPARKLHIVAAQTIVPARSQVDFTIQVQDTFNNNVRDGVAVICSTSAGQLSHNLASTDIDGRAHIVLSTGTQAGPVTVKAQLGSAGAADSTVVQVLPGNANSIQLELNPLSVEAAGTGGQSSSQLRALVRDANNNPAPDGIWVTFDIAAGGLPGGGININNEGLSDSAQTTNGLAVVTLNAGTALGPFTIIARTMVEGEEIRAQSSAGSVVSGPPASIVIYPSEIADDGGGSIWDLEVSALVLDALNNAVRCSVAVFFEVTPDTAQILSASVGTCNLDKNGVRRAGTAYTTLRYLSPATNQQIAITARTAAPNPVQATILFQLPIQTPFLDLICTPNAWNFTERNVNPSQIWCTAYVQDDHETFINGAEVVFTTQRGRLYSAATGGTEITDGRRFTGPAGSSPQNTSGMCFVWLRGDEDFVFPGPVPEVTCEVRAEVEGYGSANESVVVNFQH